MLYCSRLCYVAFNVFECINLTNKHQNVSKDPKMYTWFTQCCILIYSEDQEKINLFMEEV